MQALESGNEIVQMEGKVALPTLDLGSTSDDSSDTSLVFPRIGDEYQAKILPLNPSRWCNTKDKSESNSAEENDDDYEELFAEGLPVPIMQIPYSSPKISPVKYEMDCRNEPSLESLVGTKELAISMVKKECGYEQDSFKVKDERCIQDSNCGDMLHSMQDQADSFIAETKGEISITKGQVDNVCIDSVETVSNAPDALFSGRGRRRRRGKGVWKRVKKAKVELSKPTKQRFESSVANDQTGQDLNSRSCIMVPGRPSEPWTETEEDVFILALYIFGKNFTAVQSFMETKKMKDILAYYYSKFYGTESYWRWAESRKIKSRKCFQGQRIFSGWRQQELSMRLLPHVPEHLKEKIPDAMKEFSEGRISIEEFVKELKTLVGLNMLVQAIGIGKGNHDLTAALMDPMKSNQVPSTREIPTGRACSSLSTEEIVKFLTGDYRLSKARSNDLFWEAVWPRLLARGWHSEQPEDQASLASRNSLVFLIPGVQKFSRRILVKGVHYFDSLSEVLSQVASEPRLLDPPKLEMGEMTESKVNPESLSTAEILEEQSDRMRDPPCYLTTRCRRSDIESYVFTIVDTSLVSEGEEPARFRQSRMLSAEDLSACLSCDSGETEDPAAELVLSTEVKVGQPSILDSRSAYPADAVPVLTHNKNLAEYDEINTASPSHGSALPSSQSEQNSYCSTGLILQTGPSVPISETGISCSSFSSRKRTWDLNQEGCIYHDSDTKSQEANDAVSNGETPFSCNDLPSISKQRRLCLSNCDESETTDSRLTGSGAATEKLVVAASLLDEFDAKKEIPAPVLETDIPEEGKCTLSSTHSTQEKSDKELSSLLSGSWPSFNNALYSKSYRSKSQTSLDLASPQDYSDSVMVCTISALGTAHMEDAKYEDNSFSQHDSGHAQEKTADSQEGHSSSPVTHENAQKSEQNSQLEEYSRPYQNQPNDSKQKHFPRDIPLMKCENSESQKITVVSQEHPNDSGQAQSASHILDYGQPHEVQESRVEGRRQSTRNRPLTAKALEAFASGFYTARKRKGGKNTASTDSCHTKIIARQFIYGSTSLLNDSSLDNNDITIVDTSMESVEEGNNDSHLGHKSRSSYKRRRTHAVMKVPKTGLHSEILGQEKKEDMGNGILVSEVGN